MRACSARGASVREEQQRFCWDGRWDTSARAFVEVPAAYSVLF